MADHKHNPTLVGAVMERTLFRNLVGFALLAALFYIANRAFTDVIDDVVESKYEWVAERFTLSVGHIHKEWMFKGKPKALTLRYYISAEETANIVVQVNKLGWPLNISNNDRTLNCLNLWMLFAHEEGHRKSMLDLTSHLKVETTNYGCAYYYENDGIVSLIFDYNLYNGKVSSVQLD